MIVRITAMILRISALLALVLGMLFWTGYAESLVDAHMLLGLLVALSLWMLGVTLAITGEGNWWLTGGAFVLAGIILIFGLIQERLLPGALHWVIQVIHLLLGLSALGLGEIITRQYKQFNMRAPAESTLR
jgi:ABC-type multidrug transport system permease subunit